MMIPATDGKVRETVASAFALAKIPGLRYIMVDGHRVVVTCDLPLRRDILTDTSVLVTQRLTETLRGVWVVRLTG
jgi:hypothetical protein